MAEEQDFEGDEPEFEGGGGGKKKLLLMVVLPILLILGGAAAAYFTGLADPLLAMISGEAAPEEQAAAPAEGEHAAPAADHAKPAEAAPAAGADSGVGAVFYEMPEMLVNINTAGRTRNFLKIKVSLELTSEADIARIDNVLPRIVDNFQVYLRELRLEDLQGAAGMYRLREELLNRVNAAVRPSQVKDVLFKDMIVQ
ncbi:MAG: flagellar basal body-associated FliL family protein [Rhodospirillaceae bacterium]|nr:flagellar basal body-associated FliL family protein [Rhodospirillaceae bacterium]